MRDSITMSRLNVYRTILLMIAAALSIYMMLGQIATARGEEKSVTPEAASKIRNVIESQLRAFQNDDANGAFALASLSIRDMFGTADNFLEMVKTAYPVVYRPASVQFLTPQRTQDSLMQPVRMSDASGKAWTALYRMEPQKDGGWLISGCVLARVSGEET